MTQPDQLAARFEADRPRLTGIARRMLGSGGEAEDAVQEAWLRLSRQDPDGIDNLSGWLTTVVSRICLNVLQARRSRPEDPYAEPVADDEPDPLAGDDPEREALVADSVGLALLVVLETLAPSERLAFVLHDMFGVAFDEIAPIVGRSEPATRQLASRARRRLRGTDPEPGAAAGRVDQARVVEAFIGAARGGDFAALLALLDPDVTLHADAGAVALGAPAQRAGAEEVAGFLRIARGSRAVLADGVPAAAWMPGGRLNVVFAITAAGGRITAVQLIGDPKTLAAMRIEPV